MQSLKEALYVWDAFQCLFLGLILLFLRRNQCNRILSFFFLIGGGLVTLQYFFNFKNYLYILPEFSFVADIIRFSFAPTLYLYIYLVLKKKLPAAWGLYYLPAAAFALYFVVFQLLRYQPYHIKYYAFTTLRPVVLAGQCVVFLFFLRQLHALIRTAQPDQPHVRKWIYVLRVLLWFKAIPVLYLFTMRMIVGFYNKDYVESSQQIIFILLDVVIMLVVLVQLFQHPFILALPRIEPVSNQRVESTVFPELLEPEPDALELPAIPESKPDEDTIRRKVHISPEEARPYLDRLTVLVEQDKIHLTPELNEKLLADAVGIQPYLLSKLLNDHVGETFNEFLNRNRIEEAKRMLESPKTMRFTIFAIALECGYNSESVFYTNFKRYTGLTPKKYKEEKSKVLANAV
ncbi:MAG: helix-turn-helix transcriptional regulator [Bacteroidetes bacterium]|nr:helix-turn-helix transcriptional regulator [Fibrella sp.]